ncbi:MAG: cytochrome bc complex cytochrome b subunit [Acidobacteriota bacterium]
MEKLKVMFEWVSEGLRLPDIMEFLRHKKVPVHRYAICYYFGGMTLFLFLIQVITGILLLLYYRPSPESAFESVQFIMTKVSFGWLIRSIHGWCANLMVFMAFVHMLTVFLMKAYRPPREFTWLSGIFLFFLTLTFGFSGYLLPWNELSFFATKVGTDIVSQVPFIGHQLLVLLRGGEHVTGATLTRFFGIHVAILPLITTFFLVVHLALVQIHGMSTPITILDKFKGKMKEMTFWPDFLMRDVLGWFVMLGIIAALASLYPWELGEKADPFAPAPAGIRPEWYFMFMFQTLKYVPAKIAGLEGEMVAVLSFGFVALFWMVVPFLDRWAWKEQRSPIFTIIGYLGIVYMLIFTVLGYLK